MSASLPNGSQVHIASGLASGKTVSAVTNANPAVCTSTAHGYSNGDIVVLSSGWSRATDRVFRVSSVATNSFALEGFDTSDTALFPASGGAGTAYKVSGWTQLTQILEVSTAGGEQQFVTYQYLEADREVQIPTNKSAQSINMQVADDPTLAGFILASTANDDRDPRAIRITAANSALSFYYAYVSVNRIPSLDVNQVSRCPVNFSLLNEPVRYSS